MTRRSKKKGGFGAGKSKRPSAANPQAVTEFEALLDEVYDSYITHDPVRLRSVLELLAFVPPFAPDVITDRIIEGREQAVGIMLAILRDIAKDRYPTYLQRIIKARNAPDHARYEAQRMLGWDGPREAQRRLGFLKSLREPYAVLADSVDVVGSTWPDRIEVAFEVKDYLLALDPRDRHEALDRILEKARWNAIPFLHGLLQVDDEALQLRAIAALAEHRFSGSRGPLRRLADTTADTELRQRAEAVLGAIVFDRDTAPEDGEATFPNAGLRPLLLSKLTRAEPDGGQSIWVARELGGDLARSIGLYIDANGISAIDQYGAMTADDLDGELALIEGEFSEPTAVDLAVARGLVEMGLQRHARTQTRLLFEFELAEPLLHETYPPPADEAVVVPILDDGEYAGRIDLVAQGEQLIEHDLFNEWALPLDRIVETMMTNPPPDDADEEQSLRALHDVVLDADGVDGLREGLRRQAWLLDARGDTNHRDVALALAAWLPTASADDLYANPFVRDVTLGPFNELWETFQGLGIGSLGFDEQWPYSDADDLEARQSGVEQTVEAAWRVAQNDAEETAPDR